ncbi:MAG: NapC/NirT family cytochrome c [Magnetococcales bacterium]|nr:NapC/NirT family cytochrome c [Magnetococcales bacterium]
MKKIWELLKSPSNKPLGLVVFAGMMVGMFGWIIFNGALGMSNSMEFCVSCHEMSYAYEEYKETVHYKSPSGVRATCADCHVPKADSVGGWFAKMKAKMMASKDTYHYILGTYDTKEKYEAGRWAMANAVWDKMRARNSKECLSCHDFDAMDLEEQDRSARKKHGKAIKAGEQCIDCHTGIAHEEPEEPEEEEEEEEG